MKVHEVYLIFILGTLVFTMFAFFLILFLIHYKRKQQMHLTEKLSLQHQYRQTLLQTRLEVQEQSFKYFSEEIHDNVGQVLTLCKLHLHQLSDHCAGTKASELIANSTHLLTQALTDLRSISHTLNGNFVARAGLREALEKELKYICSAKGVNTTFGISGEPFSLGQEAELLVFRIVQESIANALKHAAPKNIHIQATYDTDDFAISVSDDGHGFDTADIPLNGLGIANMHERARLLGGHILLASSPGQGTVITLHINRKDDTNASAAA